MDPHTNKLRPILDDDTLDDGTPVPSDWTRFELDEEVVLKGYRFRIAAIEPDAMRLVPVGPVKKRHTKRGEKNRKFWNPPGKRPGRRRR
jgi:hypothetical protein